MKVQVEVEVEKIAEAIIKELVESGRVVEVIRCKDCKYYLNNSEVGYPCCSLDHQKFKADDWFCADGERREE